MITESNQRGESLLNSTGFFLLFIGSFRSTAVASEEEMLALRPPSIRSDPYVPEVTTGDKMEILPETAARPNCADCDPVSDKPPLSYPWNVFLHLATSDCLVTVENDQKADSEMALGTGWPTEAVFAVHRLAGIFEIVPSTERSELCINR